MDDCKGVRHEFDSQGTSQCVAHDFGRAFLELLGWASPALVLLAFVVLAFGVHAPKAYALSAKSSPEMVIDGNMVGDDAGSKGYLCVNCSPYTATLELIGHYSDIIQITDEQYSWLMGGNNPFATLADKWQELKGGESDEPTNTWLGDDGFIDGWLILAGKGNCWYGTFTDNQIRMAEIAFNSIMEGGTGEEGGGSGGVPEGDSVEVTVTCNQDITWKGYSFSDGQTVKLVFPNSELYQGVLGREGFTYSIGFAPYGTNTSNAQSYITLWWYDADWEFEKYYDAGYNCVGWQIQQPTSGTYTYGYIYTTNNNWYYDTSSSTIHVSSVNWSSPYERTKTHNGYYVGLGKDNMYFPTARWSGWDYYAAVGAYIPFVGLDFGTNSEPEPPDVPKPPDDDPEPPSPTPPTPDPPKPKDPTPRDPTPKPDPPRVYPKIDLPDVHITTEPTNTEPTDYTPWLRAIYNELKAFHEDFGMYFQDLLDELENHCQHIRDEIATQASYLGDCVEDVANEVTQQGNNLSNTIWEYADWLSKYMDAFGEWLVEHLDFNNEVNVDPYDDTSLMYWLRRIYTKLGGSNNPVNTRPTDPVTNPKDTGNWLNELWENILKELAQVFPNLMIDLGLIFDDLKSKFPFSIPWDIHALLLLLVTEPVAPHFTVPMYAFTTSLELEQVGEYDIDLSFYTDYLMGVHLMLEIAWIGYMLKHTKDYMELIEAVIPS